MHIPALLTWSIISASAWRMGAHGVRPCSGDDFDLPQLVLVLLDMGVASPSADLGPIVFVEQRVSGSILHSCTVGSYAQASNGLGV